MGYSIIQSTNQSEGASPVTATFTNTPSSGNLILVSIANETNGNALTSVQDGNSNNFTLLQSKVNSLGPATGYLYALIARSSQSKAITATLSGATLYISIYEFSGNATSTVNIIDNFQALSTISAITATTNSSLQPTVVALGANDLLFSQIVIVGAAITSPSWTTSGGTTVNMLQENKSGGIKLFDGYAIETGIGTFSPYASWTTSKQWIAMTTLLRPKSSGDTSNMFAVL